MQKARFGRVLCINTYYIIFCINTYYVLADPALRATAVTLATPNSPDGSSCVDLYTCNMLNKTPDLHTLSNLPLIRYDIYTKYTCEMPNERRVGDADVVKASAVVDRGRLCMHIAGKAHISGRVVGSSHKCDRARASPHAAGRSRSTWREGILHACATCAIVIEMKVRYIL